MSHTLSATADQDNDNMVASYQRAAFYQQQIKQQTIALNTTVYPHWIKGTQAFWYVKQYLNSDEEQPFIGSEYRRVDAPSSNNTAAFNRERLAQSLSEAASKPVDKHRLPITDLTLMADPQQVEFSAFGQRWHYNEASQHCLKLEQYPADWSVSPDGRKAVFVRDYNLWLKDLTNGEERALTEDGEIFNEYATAQPMSVYGLQGESQSLEALWSADSQRIFTLRVDIRDVATGAPLVRHVPEDGSLRPRLESTERRVALPGDEQFEAFEFLAINVTSGNTVAADYRPCPVCYPPYVGYLTSERGWWGDSRYAYFIDQVIGGKAVHLVQFDTTTGATRKLITEQTETGVTLIPVTQMCTMVIPLVDSNELIWFSERSGHAHLYLYELDSGRLKQAITGIEGQGGDDWQVRNVLHFDTARRELWIQTAGRVAGRNPYYCDICRVDIDSGELITVATSDHEYIVCDRRSRVSFRELQCPSDPQMRALGVSPDGEYIITTRSRVDTVPETLLFDRKGNPCSWTETADVSALPAHWVWPEPVMLKSAEGDVDIYGVVFRPSNFDPDKRYPVLDCSYGYTAPAGAFNSNNYAAKMYMEGQSYAELGFIVVMINNRGNEGLRGRTFNDYQDPLLPIDPQLLVKYHKADCVAGIKQLAKRYPYMDSKRVGVVEFVTIPTALAGMFVHPEFYQVGVSVNPLADYRLAGATGRAPGEWPQLESLAARYKGRLLMVAGMMDWAWPVSMTLRIAEALQKQGKRFDMLLLPNLAHSGSPYVTQRTWDHLVEHLQGVRPPVDLSLEME